MTAVARKISAFQPFVKEVRIHLCQKSEASKGVRDFVEKYYVDLKKANPNFPILIRECSGVLPKLYARYEYGREENTPLSNLSAERVLETLNTMTSQRK
ncbi:NADH dehydrogenase [ubiquinone] 1 alpha subcomplex subunit 2-like [Artemia franciscana]|uniref:NADH dehydrogenase [ubiquinone] 1 alpha subcomplex subunit 2-like n=1 Tax=Artemia franciscana TaxID=6661 RepID=UPI0032D9E639